MASKVVRLFSSSQYVSSKAVKYDINTVNRNFETVSPYTTIPQKNIEQHIKPDLNKAINDATKIVGYPTAHLSLRLLLSDELSDLAGHLGRLVTTNHPLLNIARELIYGRNVCPTKGLIVLLISKAAGYLNSTSEAQIETANTQRKLAEIIEIINAAHQIHKSVVNISSNSFVDEMTTSQFNFGNKIAILSGDYLLANASTALTALRFPKITELISRSISDFVASEFICLKDSQDNCLPFSGLTIEIWEKKTSLSVGSLLSNSCRGAMLLAGHKEDVQEKASDLGHSIALAMKTHSELQCFLDVNQDSKGNSFDLTSSPVILFLQNNPQYLTDHIKDVDYENFDFKMLQRDVAHSSALSEAIHLNHKFTNRAQTILDEFDKSEGKSALYNIISALKEL